MASPGHGPPKRQLKRKQSKSWKKSQARDARKPSICGAFKRDGTKCRQSAGWGTTHIGIGRCKFHGSLPSVRKPADYNEQAFQGLHARFILIVIDEACGVPESLWTAVMTLMTNENARVLAIGNPDDPGSHFAQVCKPGSGWNVISIPAFDSPNFTGEQITADMAENLVTPMWVEDRRRDWGEGSPLWQAKVLAEFPDISDEYLITP